jgi:hypothetical protein
MPRNNNNKESFMKKITKQEIIEGNFNKNEKYFYDGWLDLAGCTSLTSLPKGLTVGGWLNLRGCTALTSLPEGLTVEGEFYLRGCTSLTALPEGLAVGGSLYLGGCTSLKVVSRKNLGNEQRTGYAVRNKGELYFSLGCHFDNFDNTMKAVGKKYGNNSDYVNSILDMKNEFIGKK